MVHVYTYVPNTDTVAVADGSFILLKVVVPGPDTCAHVPVPVVGVLPPRLPLIRPHTLWLAGTVATVAIPYRVTDIFAVLGVQGPFVMVQVYTYVPESDTVAVAAGSLGLLNMVVPGPDVCVHTPVPIAGVFPPRLLVVSPHRN